MNNLLFERRGGHMARQRRVELTQEIMNHFFEKVFQGEVSEFSAHKGLPYSLVYNLVHGRINSLSAVDYRRIFGENPPEQEAKRVNAEFFRGMVRLWLFLNEGVTERDLYSEFYGGKRSVRKTDYRIFTGATRTVEGRLERIMDRKFANQGLEKAEIRHWIRELDQRQKKERIPFEKVKPLLERLRRNVGVHPSRLLNRWVVSYETGQLKTISKALYERLVAFDRKAQEVSKRPTRRRLEKLREEIYGVREGLVLFSEVEEELEFLKEWGSRSPKKYLGRSMGKYRRAKLKRVASWRVKKIKRDCEKVIEKRADQLPVAALPKQNREERLSKLTGVLEGVAIVKMVAEENSSPERDLLRPLYHAKEEYESEGYGYVSIEEAGRLLNMSDKAFGLLMAQHSDIFKKIGKYEKKWFVPDLYLIELTGKRGFELVRAKYEWLARWQGRGWIYSPAREWDVKRELIPVYVKPAKKEKQIASRTGKSFQRSMSQGEEHRSSTTG
jgi:hypothetical protein